jgi:hypothetical protein
LTEPHILAANEVLVGPDGVRVERILVQRYLDRPPQEMLRVRRGSYLVADCSSVAEVARLVDLATLVPEPRAANLAR